MNQEFFYRLVSLPLFLGLTREEALDMAGYAHFDFSRPAQGACIVAENQECKELIFAIQGGLRSVSTAADFSYTLEEYIPAPAVIQPECLFGRRPYYTRAVYADTPDVQLLTIRKDDVRDILFSSTVFRLNYLNNVCTSQQVKTQRLLHPVTPTLRDRFVNFVRMHCEQMSGRKQILVGMNQLATHLVTTRLNVSRLLHQLENEGLIIMQRGAINIPDAAKLFGAS